MRIFYALILAVVLVLGGSCTGSKSYSNKAKKLQNAGLNDEAASFYLQALQRNTKNVDAKIGLKETGQIQIENTLTAFYKAYSVTNYKEAVYTYQKALNYKKRYSYFVSMEIPPYYEAYYSEMLVVYLRERYEVAGDLLYEEKFNEANVVYKEIIQLDPEYKDAQELSLQSTVEPLYRNGINAFDQQKYRKCYAIMSDVLAKKTMYKDAIDYKDRALEEGQVTVAVLSFRSINGSRASLTQTIQSNVVAGIIKVNDPFIKVLDRSNTDILIKEQKISVKEASIGNAAIKTGELLGANILISGKLLNYAYSGGRISAEVKKGFEAYKVKKTNPETKKSYYETYYRRVKYTEYTGKSALFTEVQYQMVSAETGEVLKSDVIRDNRSDYVNYIDFKGSSKRLYSGKLTSADELTKNKEGSFSSVSRRVSLKRLARETKRSLKQEPQLRGESLSSISKTIVRGATNFDIND